MWNIKAGELLSRWKDDNCKAEVTIIAQSKADQDIFAVGYSDGSIRVWDCKTAQLVMRFNGHRSAVTTLAFDGPGTRLASGGKDAQIIVWDLISEVGLYRLKGHKDQITGVEFLRESNTLDVENEKMHDGEDCYLLSTGKDTLIKLWELSTQHCMETHVAHNGECWGMALSPDQRGCLTIGNDGEIKVWVINSREFTPSVTSSDTHCLLERGYLYRANKDRGAGIAFHPTSNFIATHGTDKSVEIWRIKTEDEIKRALKRKRKRLAEKKKVSNGEEAAVTSVDDISSATVEDIFVSYVVVRTGGKVREIDWASKPGKSNSVQLLVSLSNNSLELYDIPIPSSSKDNKKAPEVSDYKKLHSIELAGHRSDVRALALSSDDRMLASASSDSLKVWNVKTSTCIRTFNSGYSLCCSFLPGDKIVSSLLPPMYAFSLPIRAVSCRYKNW